MLCILEGFLNELNIFFLNYKSGPAKTCLNGIDEDYVSALELYCLLKQRLLDVKHNWRTVMTVSFSLPTNVKYASKFDIKMTMLVGYV